MSDKALPTFKCQPRIALFPTFSLVVVYLLYRFPYNSPEDCTTYCNNAKHSAETLETMLGSSYFASKNPVFITKIFRSSSVLIHCKKQKIQASFSLLWQFMLFEGLYCMQCVYVTRLILKIKFQADVVLHLVLVYLAYP